MQCLRRESRFERSVTDEQLLPHLIRVHDVDLVGLLGVDCVNELCDAKAAGTLTALQIDLISQLQSWIGLVVQLRYLTSGRMKLHASGPVVPQPSNAVSPDGPNPNLNPNRTVNTVIDYDRRDAKFYRLRIRRFLNDNIASFPCFKQPCGCSKPIYVA